MASLFNQPTFCQSLKQLQQLFGCRVTRRHIQYCACGLDKQRGLFYRHNIKHHLSLVCDKTERYFRILQCTLRCDNNKTSFGFSLTNVHREDVVRYESGERGTRLQFPLVWTPCPWCHPAHKWYCPIGSISEYIQHMEIELEKRTLAGVSLSAPFSRKYLTLYPVE